jgi:hypothetical protein
LPPAILGINAHTAAQERSFRSTAALGPPPPGTAISCAHNTHHFGSYIDLVVLFDDEDDVSSGGAAWAETVADGLARLGGRRLHHAPVLAAWDAGRNIPVTMVRNQVRYCMYHHPDRNWHRLGDHRLTLSARKALSVWS